MKNNIEVDYRNAIKAKYEVEKKGEFHGFLENPSPAQIREICLLKFDNGLDKSDESIFRMYFKVREGENLRESIYNCHIPKFKTLQLFLIGGDKKTNILNLNFIAILVDFKPRPFNKFSRLSQQDAIFEEHSEEKNSTEPQTESSVDKKTEEFFNQNSGDVVTQTTHWKKKVGLWMGVVVIIFSVGFTTKQFLFAKKECMQWQKDHYEAVDCRSEINTLYSEAAIIPFDEDASELNKLRITDTTTFYKGGKAIVWYCKIDDKTIECFDDPGFHPITGKALRPITDYIIDKYLRR